MNDVGQLRCLAIFFFLYVSAVDSLRAENPRCDRVAVKWRVTRRTSVSRCCSSLCKDVGGMTKPGNLCVRFYRVTFWLTEPSTSTVKAFDSWHVARVVLTCFDECSYCSHEMYNLHLTIFRVRRISCCGRATRRLVFQLGWKCNPSAAGFFMSSSHVEWQ